MKYLKILGLMTLLGLLVLGAAGCGETGGVTANEQVAVDDYDGIDLNKAFGGLTATDETDAFGDAYYTETEYLYEDDASDDPLQIDAEVLACEDDVVNGDPDASNRPIITFVRLLWGQLDGLVSDSGEEYGALDWSGRLHVDRGIVVVRRVILFERPWDHLVHPRLDRQTVAWISHTGPHFDGLIVQIIEPPVQPDGSGELPQPNVLHLSTPQISLDFPMPEVNGLDETHPVDELGNALRIEGHFLSDIDLCPKGFLSGVWVHDPQLDEEGLVVANGYFKGRWVDVWGRLKGYLRGRYGVNDAGEKVFFGKYINRGGQFRGLLRGTYGPAEDTGLGVFRGEWVNAAETVEGVLGGQYVQIPDRPGGFFAGRWATLCDQEAVESIE